MRKFYLLICLLGFFMRMQGQPGPGSSLTALLEQAEKNYPLLKAKKLETAASQKNIDIAQSGLIPTLDAAYQLNIATYNNITGMAYPQYLVPISGPPSADNAGAVPGSAVSLLFNWQPLTFGKRQSALDVSKATVQYAMADEQNEVFRHKIKVIDTYLDWMTASTLETVYRENISRAEEDLRLARSLVSSGIKPGVDTALMNAELARARVDWLNSRKDREQRKILLSELLATDSLPVMSDSFYFNHLPASVLQTDSSNNPLLSLYGAALELSKSRKKQLLKSAMPTLGVWGTTYARGSAVDFNGNVKSSDGLSFQRYNYGLGLQLSIPLLVTAHIRPQRQQQDYIISMNQEKQNEIALQLKKQNQLADTAIHTALAIAQESPLYFESANYSYNALKSRYQSGLANLADLIQAQYAFSKADADKRIAYMAVWKALLYKAAVNGDLNFFVKQVN